MPAKVSIVTTSIGCHARHSWRSVASPRSLAADEVDAKVEFSISRVSGGRDRVQAAFELLRRQGDIADFSIGILGSTPWAVCANVDTTSLQRERRVDYAVSLGLRQKLLELLNSPASKTEG